MPEIFSGASGFWSDSGGISGEVFFLWKIRRYCGDQESVRKGQGRFGRISGKELPREKVSGHFGRTVFPGSFQKPFRYDFGKRLAGDLLSGDDGESERTKTKRREAVAGDDPQGSERGFVRTLAAQWLEEIQGPEGGKEPEEIWEMLLMGVRILQKLPAKAQYLPVFAAQVTGNPHAFDDGTRGGRYLEQMIRWYLKKRGENTEIGNESPVKVFPLLEKQRLFWKAGILKDDVSNYALATGIRAQKKDGCFHEGMDGFFAEGQPVQIPLSVIDGWESLECPENRIFIVENPSVYAMLCGQWKKNCALLCMNGQPRLSSLLILDLLAKRGTKVWYAGDFDPEGLLIGQKLKQYYQGEFHYWHMTAEDYEKSKSREMISPRRLKMLDNIWDEQLAETAEMVKKEKIAGYQENIWSVYLEDMLSISEIF